jgi:hypothetical protein
VEKLCISQHRFFKPREDWELDVLGAKWIEILRPFTSVKNLYVNRGIVPYFLFSMQELRVLETFGRGTTEELPALQNIFLEHSELPSYFGEVVEKFAAVRLSTRALR